MAILDSSSLGSLVQHVKAYVNNQINVTLNTSTISKATSDAQGNVISDTYATKTYTNTAINTALTMANYVKPSSTSAISTSDTLTQAIGKLEKALDEKVDSDDESVATFDSNNKLVFPDGTKIWIS